MGFSRIGTNGNLVFAVIAALAMSILSEDVHAVPSFGRQTGMACEACHTVFPELTPFGRRFKLNGYLLDNMPQVQATNAQAQQELTLNQIPPLSVMVQVSYTRMKKSVPDDTVNPPGLAQNGAAALPQQASLFYAGRIAPSLGGFIQLTYANNSSSASVGIDNVDLRYARHFSLLQSDTVFGLTLNNNPTVQDVWNTTPAWQVPFSQQSNAALTPTASSQVDGSLTGQVAGLTSYLWWNDSVYAELGGYRSARTGGKSLFPKAADGPTIDGLAPYWRLAYERLLDRSSLSFGTFGMLVKLLPATTLVPLGVSTDRFRDAGLDAQYQYIGDDHIGSVQAVYIDERRALDATFGLLNGAANAKNTLKTFRLGGSYYYQRKWGGSLGYFSTTGTTDALFYQPAALTGFNMNKPDSRGWRAELDYMPWQNVKMALQYVIYNKFNGGSTNYDGSGRNASSNNTLYLLAWINF